MLELNLISGCPVKGSHFKAPVTTGQLIDEINPIIRGWGNYYKKAHVRKLFNRLDRWIRIRIWSHRYKRWRNVGWKVFPESKLHGELGLVSLIKLIPSLNSAIVQPCESWMRE